MAAARSTAKARPRSPSWCRSPSRVRPVTGMCPGRRTLRVVRFGLGLSCRYEDNHLDPGDVFTDAEKLARSLKKSRSQLYSHALREYVARHTADQVTEALDRVCGEAPPADYVFAKTAARRTLRRSQW